MGIKGGVTKPVGPSPSSITVNLKMPRTPAIEVGTSKAPQSRAAPPIPAHCEEGRRIGTGRNPAARNSSRMPLKLWLPTTASSAAVSTTPSKARTRTPA